MATENGISSAGEQWRRLIINGSEPAALPSSPPITKLDDDLLVEILIRSFPNPKSACRCKSVCKRWISLISAPHFTRRLVSTLTAAAVVDVDEALPPHHDLIISDSPPKPILTLLPASLSASVRHPIRVFDCFKDLLLCGFADKVSGQYGSYSFLICNSFTKQWLALPLAPRKPMGAALVPRLVCQPHSDDDDDDSFHGYRFKVVCIYHWRRKWGDSTVLDVFCSESGEWTEAACVLDRDLGLNMARGVNVPVVSWNGELFWLCPRYNDAHVSLVGFDPFCDLKDLSRLTSIDHPRVHLQGSSSETQVWDISISRGDLHVIRLEANTGYGGLRDALSIWRLEKDRQSWRKMCEVPLVNVVIHSCCAVKLHPERPEIVFLGTRAFCKNVEIMVRSCDLRTGEAKFLAKVKHSSASRWTVFQPRVDWFPTPIPRYEELQGKYDGSLECLDQSGKALTAPPSQ